MQRQLAVAPKVLLAEQASQKEHLASLLSRLQALLAR
jgi:hypothetical protein